MTKGGFNASHNAKIRRPPTYSPVTPFSSVVSPLIQNPDLASHPHSLLSSSFVSPLFRNPGLANHPFFPPSLCLSAKPNPPFSQSPTFSPLFRRRLCAEHELNKLAIFLSDAVYSSLSKGIGLQQTTLDSYWYRPCGIVIRKPDLQRGKPFSPLIPPSSFR